MPESLFLIKLLTAATLLKKETLAQVFSCEFCKIFKNTFFTEYLWETASIEEYVQILTKIQKEKPHTKQTTIQRINDQRLRVKVSSQKRSGPEYLSK